MTKDSNCFLTENESKKWHADNTDFLLKTDKVFTFVVPFHAETVNFLTVYMHTRHCAPPMQSFFTRNPRCINGRKILAIGKEPEPKSRLKGEQNEKIEKGKQKI